jgi:hypothetical protein
VMAGMVQRPLMSGMIQRPDQACWLDTACACIRVGARGMGGKAQRGQGARGLWSVGATAVGGVLVMSQKLGAVSDRMLGPASYRYLLPVLPQCGRTPF